MKNRKHILFQAVFPVCLAVILCASQSFAHRINIFALVEAGQIRVECKFSKKSPAQNSPVTILDKASGKQLALKNTDDQGIALFPVTAEMKSAPLGLIAHINAGEGHENDFEIEKSELDGASASSGTEMAPAPAAAETRMRAAAEMNGSALSPRTDSELRPGASRAHRGTNC